MKMTEQQREQALLHATVWDNVSSQLRELARQDNKNIQTQGLLEALSGFALIVSGEFREVISSGRVEE
jgi:hypothetical protein